MDVIVVELADGVLYNLNKNQIAYYGVIEGSNNGTYSITMSTGDTFVGRITKGSLPA